jgi:hypothetical protein
VEDGNTDEAIDQAEQLTRVLHLLNDQLGQAQKLLEGL